VRTIVRVMDIDCDGEYCGRCGYREETIDPLYGEETRCSLFDVVLSWWLIDRRWDHTSKETINPRCDECMACDVQFMRDGRPE
jgi:hypothetical protein